MGYKDTFDERNNQARTEEMQVRALRLSNLARVYEGADRVLTGDPVIVEVVNDGPAAAWSDGRTIWLNASKIEDMDIETLTNITGLNYHELAHHFYSPRKGTDLLKWVIEEDKFHAYNLLEDQRIEALFIARYPSVMPYLEEVTLRWLGNTPETAVTNYVTIYGRRYLPVELREAFRDIFYKPELIPDIQRIVDEYRLLAFPRDYKRARELIEEFDNLVVQHLDLDMLNPGAAGCSDRSPIAKGRPEPGRAQERDSKVAAGMGQRESEYVAKDPSQEEEEEQQEGSGSGEGEGEPADGEGQNGESQGNPTPGNGEAKQPKDAAEAIAMREAQLQRQQGSPQHSKGHQQSKGGLPDNIADFIEDRKDSIYNRKDVVKDIRRKQRIIITGKDDYVDEAEHGVFNDAPVPTAALLDYKKFAQELQKLRDDAEPHWQRRTASGKLNIRRVIKGCEVDEAFDRWTEGDDSTDIEAVILVDRSGSMSSDQNDRQASLACWTIKRALEHIDSPVTVYAFDDGTEVAYTKREKADRTKYKFIFGSGGTDPREALLMAEKVLMSSQRKNKLLFMITDGAFESERNDEVIARIAKRGVLTTMVLIMHDRHYAEYAQEEAARKAQGLKPRYNFQHGMEIFRHVNSSRDLLALAKDVVVGAVKKKQRIV